MADIITEQDLASYLQVTYVEGKYRLAVKLANGQVKEIVGDPEIPPARVVAITLEVAARGVRNPQAFTSVTVGIDDYDKTTRREGKDADKTGVYVTEDEKAELLEIMFGIRRGRVGSIQLGVPRVP